ncbi:uncharacterized protein L969DRAFT_45708 [Mixia osmundae IAM 14324]|uniref:C2H2-type domain-containing protein n=1 Tax=Mixia osmundae (strain CBS 9802 / IAM 14324 / JCM 22182 / KY 12970) TaxID=764103 RepID=G7DTQ4_MIXOS|nr:uncharacterized protein L969DRAFT_45708 [Mixia osmundae IAM 14324]KEI41679.1 hypothetical protein L969DRAFT_45708 [Mixia osmundae IAM 14324]GAA93964.1 hypothetical protein E5Q_00610 [Mixia osmundae IAM 14324]
MPAPVNIHSSGSSDGQSSTSAQTVHSRPSWGYRNGSISGSFRNPDGMAFEATPTSFSHLMLSNSSQMQITGMSPGFGPFSYRAGDLISTSLGKTPGSFGAAGGQLEERFCRGYRCCGLKLDDLHGLLEHFEEQHVLPSANSPSLTESNSPSDTNDSRPVSPAPIMTRSQSEIHTNSKRRAWEDLASMQSHGGAGFEMDLDPSMGNLDAESAFDAQRTAGGPVVVDLTKPFGQPKTALNFEGLQNLARSMSAKRATQTSGFNRSGASSPTSSVPGTPGTDMSDDFEMSVPPSPQAGVQPNMLFPQSLSQFGEITLDDDSPAATLNPLRLSQGRSQQPMSGQNAGNDRMWTAPSSKPFKCPVDGCDKAYKQQNGLKYHRLHGHCNQNNLGKLPENRDGEHVSESMLSEMEEKPFGCYIGVNCGKRYKNMNGLRYHYQHSGPHGQIGLQMLSEGSHPAPTYPAGHRRVASVTSSRNTSRAASPSLSNVTAFPTLPIALGN